MSKLRTLAGETVLYGLGNILPRFINFFLVRVHTQIFAPADYGVFTYISVIIGLINIVFAFGMETAYFRFATRSGADPRKVFNQVQTLVMCISVPISLLFVLFSQPIANALNVGNHPEFIVWIALLMLIDAVVAIPFAQLRLNKKRKKYAIVKIINIMIIVVLNYYFLKINFNPTLGIGYIFLATLVGNATYLLFFSGELLTWRPVWNKSMAIPLLRYGWPVMVGGLAYIINEMFSRGMLEVWLPKDYYGPDSAKTAVGIFAACYKFAILMNLAVQAFRYAAEPFFFSNAEDKNSPELFARINHYFVILCCLILLGVSINLDILKYFLGQKEYWSGLSIVPTLLLAYLFLGVYYNFSIWYKITDRTYVGTILFSAGAVLTVVLNYFLIPIAGYTGSSWATLIVYFLMAASCYWIGQRNYPIPYKVLSDSSYIVATVLLIWIISKIEISGLLPSLAFHGTVVLVFLLVVWVIERRRAPAGPPLQR